jgi:hypothetical protein
MNDKKESVKIGESCPLCKKKLVVIAQYECDKCEWWTPADAFIRLKEKMEMENGKKLDEICMFCKGGLTKVIQYECGNCGWWGTVESLNKLKGRIDAKVSE